MMRTNAAAGIAGYDDEDENLKFSPVSEGGSGNSLLSGANPNLRNSALG